MSKARQQPWPVAAPPSTLLTEHLGAVVHQLRNECWKGCLLRRCLATHPHAGPRRVCRGGQGLQGWCRRHPSLWCRKRDSRREEAAGRQICKDRTGGETCVSSPDSPLLPQTQISLFRLLSLRIWLSTNVWEGESERCGSGEMWGAWGLTLQGHPWVTGQGRRHKGVWVGEVNGDV